MTDFKIKYLNKLHTPIDKKIHQGHITDETSEGIICNYNKFHFVIEDNNGNMVGALTAYTAFAEIYVDDIWVNPIHRNKGLGRELLEHLENHFKDKGYNNINLVTSQFQAPDFYKKCGFQLEFIRENKYNSKLTKFFFIKYFENTHQYQGTLDKKEPI
jgi:ribosomal protein S18 acetylase RimI-like enzyme